MTDSTPYSTRAAKCCSRCVSGPVRKSKAAATVVALRPARPSGKLSPWAGSPSSTNPLVWALRNRSTLLPEEPRTAPSCRRCCLHYEHQSYKPRPRFHSTKCCITQPAVLTSKPNWRSSLRMAFSIRGTPRVGCNRSPLNPPVIPNDSHDANIPAIPACSGLRQGTAFIRSICVRISRTEGSTAMRYSISPEWDRQLPRFTMSNGGHGRILAFRP